jgi:hypothetical protein
MDCSSRAKWKLRKAKRGPLSLIQYYVEIDDATDEASSNGDFDLGFLGVW